MSVSSIFIPNCRILDFEEGLKLLGPGEITLCVMARLSANEYGGDELSAHFHFFPSPFMSPNSPCLHDLEQIFEK